MKIYNEDRRPPPTSCKVCIDTSQPEISLQCGCAFHRGCFDQGLDPGRHQRIGMPGFCCRFCRGGSENYFAPVVYLWYNELYPNVRLAVANFRGQLFPWEASSWNFSDDLLYPPGTTEERECGICQYEIEIENMNSYAAVIASCKHKFHTTCLSRLVVFEERGGSHRMGRRARCPMCRGAIDEVFTGSGKCRYGAWERIRNSRGLQRIIFNRYSEVRGDEEEVSSPERFPYSA